ncbi:MAG: hypothetical protein ACLUJG_15270 [Lawsonibacter sp.]
MRCHERILNTLVDFFWQRAPVHAARSSQGLTEITMSIAAEGGTLSLPCNTPTTWSCWSLNGCGKKSEIP